MNAQHPADHALQSEAFCLLVDALSKGASDDDVLRLSAWRAQSPRHEKAFWQSALVWRAALPAAQRYRLPRPAEMRSQAAITRRRFIIAGSVLSASAASVSLALYPPLGLWPQVQNLFADYATGVGEQRQLALNEGIAVTLNTRTRVDTADDNGRFALKLLSGEGAIECRKPNTATVFAGDAAVRCDEGLFSVRYSDAKLAVTCAKGDVAVDGPSGSLALSANQVLTLNTRGETFPRFVNASVALAWRQGLLIFDGERLSAAVNEINRYRRGRIVILNDALSKRKISAQLEIKRLDEAVPYIQKVFGARARFLPAGVVILT